MRPRAPLRATTAALLVAAVSIALALAGCGGGGPPSSILLHHTQTATVTVTTASSADADAAGRLGFPTTATKNTTRVGGADPVADAAGAALAVYPSRAPGTHPTAVALAPTSDWEAALASSVLMAPPLHAPVLLSGSDGLPAATSSALSALRPTGAGDAGGAQVIRVGGVPKLDASPKVRTAAVSGSGPYALAAAIDRFQAAAAGRPSSDVMVASTDGPGYAMPAAGYAAESGDPILYVSRATVPAATRQALSSHQHPNIYLLGPESVASAAVARQLRRYGAVTRISAAGPAAFSAAFAAYRDPGCSYGQPCAHVPGSFGWALRSPGHGYTLLDGSRTLDAAASAALSGSGDYGPQLLVDDPSSLPRPVLNYFLDYATPGYTQQGPTAAVYNHGWVIGDEQAISTSVQSELDNLLQAVPQSSR